MYPDERVARYVTENFLPVLIHIKEQPTVFIRFRVPWTPTLLVLDPNGVECLRFVGYLPADEFLGKLALGLGHAAFIGERYVDAEKSFRQVVTRYPKTEAAPEALYWAGVAKYKASGDAAALGETAQQFKQNYTESTWATKASVWSR